MAPKQTKKQATEPIVITQIQKKWADNVKEIITIREKLVSLEKINDELIGQLWELMNKNPTNTEVVIDATEEEVKESKNNKTTDTEEKPAKSAPKKKVGKAEDNEESDKPEKSEKPVPKKKVGKLVEETEEEPPVKKPAAKATKKKEEKAEIEKPEVKKASAPVKGKIAAPLKGTPKPNQLAMKKRNQ